MTDPVVPSGQAQSQRELLARLLREKAQEVQRAPASAAQRRLWLINRLEEPNPAYNIAFYQVLRGGLDAAALERSLNELARRHGSLRTTFQDVDGEPWQLVAPRISLTLPVTDLAAIPEPERGRQIGRLIQAEADGLFDLGSGPLIRARLFRLAEREHVLTVVMHHIISDGWSVGVFVNDLFAIYDSLCGGTPVGLPRLTSRYLDYSARQAHWLRSEQFDRQLAYWRRQLDGVATLQLPTDRPRPPARSFRGATHSFTVDDSLSRALAQLAEAEGTTSFIVLAAAFSVFLHRYSGQDDVVFGAPVASRNELDLEGLIGFFVNTLVLRNDLSGNPAFRELLRRVGANALDAYANQDVPFEHLVEVLRPQREAGRNPLFQVAMALQKPMSPVAARDLEASRPAVLGYDACDFGLTSAATRVDLELHLWDDAGTLRGTWCYDTALFDAGTVERMARNFHCLLAGIAASPDARVDELPLLDAQESRLLLSAWNDTGAPYRRDAAVHELFEEWAARSPDAVALKFEGQYLSYAGLDALANQLARHLLANGVTAGQFVGVCLDRGIDLITSMLAIFKVGAVYVPLDPRYPRVRLEYLVQDAGLRAVIGHSSISEILPSYAGRLIRIDADRDAIRREDPAGLGRLATACDPAYLIYTSGSTGNPKGVVVEHRGLCKVSAEQVRLFGAGPGSRVLQFSSPNFDASLFDVVMALTTGGTLVLARPDDLQPGPPLLGLLRGERITILTIPPSSLAALAPEPLPDLKVLNVAGEACPAELVARWAGGRRFFNLYGPTECTIWSTAHECAADSGAPPIGRPIANTTLYVLDGLRQPAPIGVAGELYVGGDGLARGYLNRPALTEEKFIANPFGPGRLYRTGDKVRWRADGNLEFIGRVDQQVKVRGFRIEPGEIEAVLGQQPGVRSAVVVAREDAAGETMLVAYVVPASKEPAAMRELRNAVQQALPLHMVPGAFVALDALPLTPNGKVDTRALPTPRASVAPVAPRSEIEAAIAAIWREVLGIEQVSIDDNFFDIGGHSLKLVKVHEQVRKLTDRDLPIVTLFRHPTIRALAARLRDDGEEAPARAAMRQADGYEPIAVIGMAGRFPGAPDLARFWQNLREGVESIRFFSEEELRAAGVDARLVADPLYVRAKGYLADADLFDADFFHFTPREAELVDPQHRLFLEVAWEALENAGYDPLRYRGAIGVYAGSSENTYRAAMARDPDFATGDSLEGTIAGGKDFLATRVAYKFNLQGPAVTVQTACSTSLVAVHEACKSVLFGECDMALAGGVRVSVPLVEGYRHEPNSIFSPDGHCRAFDAAAQGTLGGDGVGVVVLKRLAAALADGDHIYAVVRGSGINNDGAAKVGYTAPSVQGQSRAIASALAAASADPGTIGYVEAHGTGTTLGDPIEIEALNQVFGRLPAGSIVIGSVKTNIGHLDAAAGIAGFIKTVLALKHQELPPSLHFTRANPQIDFARSPFFVNNGLRPWPVAAGQPRRAGVSSFGIGGTNAHVVVEEAPPQPAAVTATGPGQLLVFSARSQEQLQSAMRNLHDWLVAHPDASLADVSRTLQVGRCRFRHAAAVVCSDLNDAIGALDGQSPARVIGSDSEPGTRRVVFMFSGHGNQYSGMGLGLYQSEPEFRRHVDECCELLRAELNCDLRDVLFPAPGSEAAAQEALVRQTSIAQPALFTVEYALARLLMSWGIRPAACIGHSVGEYAAACLAGVFSLGDALRVVAARGRLMQSTPAGAMTAVALSADVLAAQMGPDIAIAAINEPSMCVVSGPAAAVDQFEARLAGQGVVFHRLHIVNASHSPMMQPVLASYAEVLQGVQLHAPSLPFVSNLTGSWITPAQATDPGYWVRHLRETVRLSDGLGELLRDPSSILIEVGPGTSLSTIAARHPARGEAQACIPIMRHARDDRDDRQCLLEAVGRLWLARVEPDWDAFWRGKPGRRVALPTYPWDRQRYWLEPGRAATREHGSRPAPRPCDVGDWFYVPSWRRGPPLAAVSRADVATERRRWLLFADATGLADSLRDRLRARGHDVVTVRPASAFGRVGGDDFSVAMAEPSHFMALMQALAAEERMPDAIAHLWAIGRPAGNGGGTTDEFLERSFYSLVHLAQAIGATSRVRPMRLYVVSDGVHAVTGEETLVPEKATLLGPCLVVPSEYENLACANVDISPAGVATAQGQAIVDRLLAELEAPPGAPVVAYRGSYRWTRTFEPVHLADAGGAPPRIRAGGVYLVTGGLRGIGLELAAFLARSAARLVLVGRNAFPAREGWEEWLATHSQDDATSGRIRRIRALEAAGAEIMVASADVADREQMRAVVASARERFGDFHGVIHSAGLPSGGLIQLKSRAEAARILAPKVAGVQVLEELFATTPLDFMVLCSSLITAAPAAGQVDYLAANAYLDAYAHQRSAAGHRTVAVNWDAWRDVGMGVDTPVPEELAEQKRRKLAGGIPTASGIDAFARVLHSVLPQVVVSARAPAQWIAAEVGPQPVSLRAAADPGAAGPPRSGHVRSRSLPSAYLAPRDEVERQVAAVWEELFGIEGIGVDDRFFDLGGHSLLAIRIVARLKADLHAELSLNEFFETPTVAGIAALVRRSNSGASLDDMVAGLSDKEVERLLAEKSGPVTS